MKKKFDCVEMKNAIQRELSLRRAGMSDRAIQAQIEKDVEESPSPIACYWRGISEGKVVQRCGHSLAKC